MIINQKIPIRNIYYMLAYAYQTLNLSELKNISNEHFENTLELYTEILLIGLPTIIRGGLIKDYVCVSDCKTVIRGKIDVNSSIKQNTIVYKKLDMVYDEFSEDIILNQILKATLLRISKISKLPKDKRKKALRFLSFFRDVSDIDLHSSLWGKFQYNRQNNRYFFLVDICRLLYRDLLISDGDIDNSQSIDDEQVFHRLFEKFIYNFYKRETKYNVARPRIKWNVDDVFNEGLPIMQTDIVLQHQNKTLIIDTKKYEDNMKKRYENSGYKQESKNMYQIFAYVNNWPSKQNEVVSGMLLYARTDVEEQPNHCYKIKGNSIYVLTIDLDQNFECIKNDLIKIADDVLLES